MARTFANLAARIVATSSLKAPPVKARRNKSEEKIVKMVETEERFKSVRGFMILWNKWRAFYFGLPDIQPKTRGQLTSIENAIEFCNENELSITMMIACVHKAFEKRRLRPSYSVIVSQGEEIYNVFYDLVIADIDRNDYVERAMK